MSDRKIVESRIGEESIFDILHAETPDGVIEQMQTLKKSYEGRDIFFRASYRGHDGAVELELWEHRPETDEEYKFRVFLEQKEAATRARIQQEKKDKEYAEYLRLKKKFGDWQ